ncbi:ABA4-like family protein [Aurantiacibacter sp. MUD11]|uniref:ABA4-like family protein n=1 Tax=Aurantiacibacter sp. MUD11 TaxID=3003265 RepID=UPI0022AAF047|nr:ABA4-like family protein [Aurantiacibacter sp. MUD11]WAT18770.1 ABA4-like family protein [Aurantiacibacter sp. MUD11]
MWDSLFGLANIWAMAAWAVLILLPRTPLAQSAIFYAGIGLLCLAYAALLGLILTGSVDPGATGEGGATSFTTIEGVRAIFQSDSGVTIGWIHYLAFDLFVGLWIAKDGDQKGISRLVQAPILLLSLVAGPAGLLVWMIVREKSARKGARIRR